MQFLQRNIDVATLIEEVLWKRYFPLNLAETGFDVVSYRKPFSANNVEKSLDWYVDV